MSKIILNVLVLAFVVSLTGCGSSESANNTDDGTLSITNLKKGCILFSVNNSSNQSSRNITSRNIIRKTNRSEELKDINDTLENGLYQMKDGKVEELYFKNSAGKKVDVEILDTIIQDENFVVLEISVPAYSVEHNYLINYSTGDMWGVNNFFFTSGNIAIMNDRYILAGLSSSTEKETNTWKKIDTETGKVYDASVKNSEQFRTANGGIAVDDDGNMIYSAIIGKLEGLFYQQSNGKLSMLESGYNHSNFYNWFGKLVYDDSIISPDGDGYKKESLPSWARVYSSIRKYLYKSDNLVIGIANVPFENGTLAISFKDDVEYPKKMIVDNCKYNCSVWMDGKYLYSANADTNKIGRVNILDINTSVSVKYEETEIPNYSIQSITGGSGKIYFTGAELSTVSFVIGEFSFDTNETTIKQKTTYSDSTVSNAFTKLIKVN